MAGSGIPPLNSCQNYGDGRDAKKVGWGPRPGWCVLLKVGTYNEAVTPLLLREADLSWHILGKSTNLSWALLLHEGRVLKEREQGELWLAPR